MAERIVGDQVGTYEPPKIDQGLPTDEITADDEPSASVEKHAIWSEYLASERGHEAVMKVLSLVGSLKELTGKATYEHARWEKIQQSGIIGLVIVAGSVLAYLGKLDSTAGVLLGTCVGYAFGRKQ